jgi:hypothetical protein
MTGTVTPTVDSDAYFCLSYDNFGNHLQQMGVVRSSSANGAEGAYRWTRSPHSVRSTFIGSVDAARSAGNPHAASAAISSTAPTAANAR